MEDSGRGGGDLADVLSRSVPRHSRLAPLHPLPMMRLCMAVGRAGREGRALARTASSARSDASQADLRRIRGAAARLRGEELEQRVASILRAEGRWNVRRNVELQDRHGNKSEIDVMYGLVFKRCVECKNYSKSNVPLEDVAKFKEVLSLNGVPASRGLFVTSSGYTPRATTIGIRCIDGEQLAAWERAAFRARRRRRAAVAVLSFAVGVAAATLVHLGG